MHEDKSHDDPTTTPVASSSKEVLDSQEKETRPTFNEQTNYVPTNVIITVGSKRALTSKKTYIYRSSWLVQVLISSP
jgi:hypothetical protein